jgi:hypothetical protein
MMCLHRAVGVVALTWVGDLTYCLVSTVDGES